ncbi:MAG: hypothetical protein AB1726_00790 [Planctomycetota bacterium]
MSKRKKGERKPTPGSKDALWTEAKRLCRLSADDIRKARELGMTPKSLLKNKSSPSQPWKAPAKIWIRELHAKRFGSSPSGCASSGRTPAAGARPPRRLAPSAETPRASSPSDLGDFTDAELAGELDDGAYIEPEDPFELAELDSGESEDPQEPPSEAEIAAEDRLMRQRQQEFLHAAEEVAAAFGAFAEVERVILIGSVAAPLSREVPRFSRFRRHRIEILHECGDVDLAVQVTDPTVLPALRRARSIALDALQKQDLAHVAHHQVDVFVFDAPTGRHLGRLCTFGTCPKDKPECLVPDCGRAPFLRQIEGFRFDPRRFSASPSRSLYEKPSPSDGRCDAENA